MKSSEKKCLRAASLRCEGQRGQAVMAEETSTNSHRAPRAVRLLEEKSVLLKALALWDGKDGAEAMACPNSSVAASPRKSKCGDTNHITPSLIRILAAGRPGFERGDAPGLARRLINKAGGKPKSGGGGVGTRDLGVPGKA